MQSELRLARAVAAPLHVGVSPSETLLVAALGVGAVFSVLVALLAFVAFYRRRTVSYLLIAVAFSTFLGKTSLGIVYLTGRVSVDVHHALEHALDVVMLALVLVAVYYARSSEGQRFDSD